MRIRQHQQEELAEMGHDDPDHMAEGHHGAMYAVTVESGETGHLDVTFDEPGELVIGCHLPGHWDAGMRADLIVTGS